MAKINISNREIATLAGLAPLGEVTVEAEDEYLTVAGRGMRLKLDRMSLEGTELTLRNIRLTLPRMMLKNGQLEAELILRDD